MNNPIGLILKKMIDKVTAWIDDEARVSKQIDDTFKQSDNVAKKADDDINHQKMHVLKQDVI